MTGSAGFEQGPDFLSVRLAFDIPADGLSTLREITEEIDRFRTSVESAGRSEDDFVTYLDRMTEASNRAAAAQQNLISVLQRQQEYQTRVMTGSTTTPSPLAQAGYQQPWGGTIMGTGRVATTVPEAAAQAEALATTNPRAYLNAQAAWGNLRPDEIAPASNANQIQETAQRIVARDKLLGSGSALSQKIAQYGIPAVAALEGREALAGLIVGQGGVAERPPHVDVSAPRRGPAAPSQVHKERQAPKHPKPSVEEAGGEEALPEEGGGQSGLGLLGGTAGLLKSGVGTVGLAAGTTLAAFGLSQKIGEMYQGYKAMGLTRGGGAAEGLQYEMGIRAQPLSSSVLTPTGWVKMGELTVGDQVIAGDGTPTTVLGTYDHGVKEVYEVMFDDGGTTRCTLDHLWAVYTEGNDLRVMRFEDMLRGKRRNEHGLLRKNGCPRYRIPLTGPVEFSEKEFPVDPYTLGVLLGDGSHGHHYVGLTCYEDEIYDLVLPDGVTISKLNDKRGGAYYFKGVGAGIPNPIVSAMREVGLMGVSCKDKFIPEMYLFGSVKQRFALLQGLIDTDGNIDKTGRVFFKNSSQKLIEGAKDLVLSLGGKAYITTTPKKSSVIRGQEVLSAQSYVLEIRLPRHLGPPAKLSRKADRYIRDHMVTRQSSTRQIVSAHQVFDEECRCIYVSHPGHLYVTENYIVTHNTMAMNPFISTEQARAIVQQGLKDGYTGKEFDTMTQFMASNLKDMNIDVGTSAEMLRKSVHEGGQSIASLNEQLAQLKDLSKTGARALPELVQGYEKTKNTLMEQGMPGAQAGKAAEIAGQWFVNEQALTGTGEDVVNAMVTNPTAQAMLMTEGGLNIPPGTLPGEVPYMVEPEALAEGSFNVIKNYALQLWKTNGSPDVGTTGFFHAAYLWGLYLQQLGINWNQEQVKLYFRHIIKGENPNVEAKQRVEETTQERGQIKERGLLSQIGTSLGTAFGGIGRVATDLFNGGEFTPGKDLTDVAWGTNPSYIPSLDTAVSALGGPSGVEVLDENGNPQQLTGAREQLEKLQSGQYKIRPKGGQSAGVTINQISSMTSADDIASFMKSGSPPLEASVTIGLSDDAAKYFTVNPNPVKLSPHERQSLSSYGDTSLNNAPPGWDMPRQRYG